MRKLLLSFLAVVISQMIGTAQIRYLVNTVKPAEGSQLYEAFTGNKTMQICGEKWKNGFTIGRENLLITPDDMGHVVFNLGGAYERLTFFCGAVYQGDNYPVSRVGILCVYADGRKILDEKVRNTGLGKRYTLDVKGVKELKFQLLVNEMQFGIAEAALWKAGETPRETGGTVRTAPVRRQQLIKDVKPYFVARNHRMTAKDETVKVGNKSYSDALVLDMSMPISGENSGETFFNIGGDYETLELVAGPLNEQFSSNAVSWISILGDGKILYEYEIKQDDIAKPITLDISGVRQLSIRSDQDSRGMQGVIAEAFLYPKGQTPPQRSSETADPRLKSLPDACKLISNIPPYSTRSSVDKQVYDGLSDYITFSMGGVRFSEGVILYKTANVLDSDMTSYAAFDLGREFDYVTMTIGFVGKSWSMTNDVISVYADDKLVRSFPVFSTMQNIRVTLPLNKCSKLRIENQGSGMMTSGAYGVGDIVVWRGEPGTDDLFVHERPECPHEIDLIDLGAPYIHYVSEMSDQKEDMFYDGSTQRHYVTMRDGTRLNKCFLLKTSVHFSLDYGVLSGADAAMGSIAGAVAAGVSFVPIASVAGAYAGSTLAGAAALLVLAAGGEAVENSCAAFNTYGEYNSLTFTVACLRTSGEAQMLGEDAYKTEGESEYKEHLLIGNNQQVVAEIALFEDMKPQTITLPIEGCQQLMFWLANTYHTSGIYVFYDLKLSKDKCVTDIPDEVKLSDAHIRAVQWRQEALKHEWESVPNLNTRYIDEYFRTLTNAYGSIDAFMKSRALKYEIYTYYLSSRSGEVLKGIKLKDTQSEAFQDIPQTLRFVEGYLDELARLRSDLAEISMTKLNAHLELPSLGLGSITVSKTLNYSAKVLKELKEAVNTMTEDMLEFRNFLVSTIDSAIQADGRKSTEKAIINPLSKGEQVPSGDRMLVENFTL